MKNPDTNDNQVILCRKDEISFDKDSFRAEYRNKLYKVDNIKWMRCSSILNNYKVYSEIDLPSELLGLRNLVYEEFRNEIRDVFEELLKSYNIKRK
jgi:hypothetical protein